MLYYYYWPSLTCCVTLVGLERGNRSYILCVRLVRSLKLSPQASSGLLRAGPTCRLCTPHASGAPEIRVLETDTHPLHHHGNPAASRAKHWALSATASLFSSTWGICAAAQRATVSPTHPARAGWGSADPQTYECACDSPADTPCLGSVLCGRDSPVRIIVPPCGRRRWDRRGQGPCVGLEKTRCKEGDLWGTRGLG